MSCLLWLPVLAIVAVCVAGFVDLLLHSRRLP